MKLLHIDSSILGAGSVSRTLSAAIVAAQQAQNPGLQVSYRDLAAQPVGHLSGAHLAAGQGVVPEDAALAADIADGAAVLDAFLAADIVVVGAPMYNFSISTQLKAWIDRLAIAGRTFRYTENGPEGLAGGKTVIIASSRGGFYGEGTPAAFLDHQETYLKGVFNFFGITDVRFIRAEGVALGDEQRTKSVEGAQAQIERLAA
ncbi:FMN-dependent NADH-azoreductase [Caulobacter sp. UNC279MFTsu5.1]|uniref:FMN-dependent NADH-azoreductase n=1 Tax=Caulobacter sp. UNC279MFTsu5.1 TaxID=1502775 RepID=UPI0008E1692F|nr:FMN-dependent NADH-azoreductase [Caulobacter sp. UNC279MFTsu5.1]SFK28025.1 FMN-dependent NADH-azoreductase [Caulobacter sp. UNC279MFTsu5.1]